MQPEAPASPVSIPQLAGQLHAELIDHQTAPGSSAVGQHTAVLASVANEHDTVLSEELYHPVSASRCVLTSVGLGFY